MSAKHKFNTREHCQHCRESCERAQRAYEYADARYSFGAYAGRYCDSCWLNSGFRDATDPDARFDELDAGERLDDDY